MFDPVDIDLPDFLTRWHGEPLPSGQGLSPDVSSLPEPLREWHVLASRWRKLRFGANRMIKPSLIQFDQGKAVFMRDATGDWAWAFGEENPDLVYEGVPGGEWHSVPERLAEFLVHATVIETIALVEASLLGDQVPDEELPGILAPMQEVGFGEWRWPRTGYRIFMTDSLIASVGPAVEPRSPWLNRSGYSSVRISGASPSALEYLHSTTSVKWLDFGFDEEDMDEDE
ncbi:hypothetical protein [Streptomyces sp. NPDC001388]|uniref:hypothetical protein n=1 Tax=Streptomyces sp. NPDC001388 TaxID=3364568 RepID=UPI0036CEB798